MARDIDVYRLLRAFASRNKLTELDYSVFAQAVQRQAHQADQTEAVYRDLAINPDTVLIPRLISAEKSGRLALTKTGNEISRIVFPEHYSDAFIRVYKDMEDDPEIPFPDEESLGLSVPTQWIEALSLDTDLASASAIPSSGAARPEEGEATILFRIVFSESIRSIVIPSAFVPDKLLEFALFKVRHYLRQGSNKEYIENQLRYAFSNKEGQLRDELNALLTRPYDALSELKSSVSDFTFSFWAYFTSALKRDLGKRDEHTSDDISAYQSALVTEFYANFYKSRARKNADLEMAFRNLDQCLRRQPLAFTWEEILGFRDSAGQPLLGKYTREELEGYLKEKTTKSDEKRLPELLIVATAAGRRYYVAKDSMLALTVRLIAETRDGVRTRMVDEWKTILEEYDKIDAMSDDKAYHAVLVSEVEKRYPLLDALLKDRLLPLVYTEIGQSKDSSGQLARLFYRGDLLPLEQLLDLPRRSVYTDAKMLLPFWYSIPPFWLIGRFFFRLGREKRSSVEKQTSDAERREENQGETSKVTRQPDRRMAFSQAARTAASQLVPSGYSIDEYLSELVDRWDTLLSPTAKRNLRLDVDSLVRDYLRSVTRSMNASSFTLERVRNLASTLADTPALLKIQNHADLEKYLELYMIKLLIRD